MNESRKKPGVAFWSTGSTLTTRLPGRMADRITTRTCGRCANRAVWGRPTRSCENRENTESPSRVGEGLSGPITGPGIGTEF